MDAFSSPQSVAAKKMETLAWILTIGLSLLKLTSI
jgi:hypothetical protein